LQADSLTRVLVHIQANLDEDVSLDALAGDAGLSRFHFAREFARFTGETIKQYTLRLRLERAAVRLLLRDASILDTAIDCGFDNHETFSRAFRRHFGVAPRDYRTRGIQRAAAELAPGRTGNTANPTNLSSTKLCRTGDLHIAFLRHVGPYEEVPTTLWDELQAWARTRRIPEPHILVGIAQDAPGVTPASQLRFDAGIRVPPDLVTRGRIGLQTLPAATFAVTTFVGPYSELHTAYTEIMRRLFARDDVRIVGVPCLEVYQTTKLDAQHALNHTDIHIPVEQP
jgi:AraC family transcriptional regulator